MNANLSKKSQKRRRKKKLYYIHTKKKRLNGNLNKNLSHENRESTQLSSQSQSSDKKEDQTVNGDNNSLITLDPRSADNSTETNELLLHEHKACELFNLVYSGGLVPMLPNRSWSIHFMEVPVRCIVISKMMIRFEVESGLTPVQIKQIVFDEKMNYELFFLNAKAFTTNKSYVVETLADITHIITFVDNIKLCSGGPETTLHANVNLECAYRDPQGRWRHNLCTLEIIDGDTCESCLSLIELLKRNGKRNKVLTRAKDFVDTAKRKESSLS